MAWFADFKREQRIEVKMRNLSENGSQRLHSGFNMKYVHPNDG